MVATPRPAYWVLGYQGRSYFIRDGHAIAVHLRQDGDRDPDWVATLPAQHEAMLAALEGLIEGGGEYALTLFIDAPAVDMLTPSQRGRLTAATKRARHFGVLVVGGDLTPFHC